MATVVESANNPFASLAQRSILNIEKDVEKRIMSDVFQKQIRVREFFFDFDKLRKGVVNEDKFRTALSMLNIYLSKEDIEELIRRYKDKDGMIRYSDFCQNVDAQFFDHDYARDNLNQTKSSANYDNYEQKVVSNALKQFKYIIKTKRILLKQPFMDFDRTKSLHVTKEQFARVLTSLGFLLDQQKFDILARNYMDKGNTREVNYVKFCQDVDDLTDLNKGADSHKEKKNDSSYVPEDVVKDTSKLNLMGTLYVSKRLATDTQTVDVERKIQGECVMKQIRIREFFKDFDNLKKGTVSETQFRRILHMSGIEVEDEEFAVLLGRYKTPDNLINYDHFCEVIDSVFTTKGIEKEPLYKVPQLDSSTALEGRRKYLALSEEEKELLQYVMEEYRRQIRDKRMLIKPNFQDFDRTNNGHVSKIQFLRILNQFGLFPDEKVLNLLLKRYIDKGNLDEVNYYDFCRDIEVLEEGRKLAQEYAESFKNPENRQEFFRKTFILNDNPNDLEDLLARMRKKVKQNRIRIGEFLRDFDKLRSGTITNTKFRMALNNATLPVSDQEFNLIVQHFKSHDKEGFIRWKDFEGAIEEVFTAKNLEKNPSTIVSEPKLQYNYGKNPMTSQEVALAEKVKRKFIEFARATRLDIKQFFKDWDRLGRNKVSPKQFRQVLATINFTLKEDEFIALVRYYQSEDDNDVRYIDFINDTNPNRYLGATLTTKTTGNPYPVPESELKDTKKSPATTFMMESSSPTKTYNTYRPEDLKPSQVDINLLLEKIRNDVKVRQLRLGDYLKDYDGLRKGLINSNKFRGVLSQMKIELTEEELEALEKHYIWTENNEYPYKINYSQFISDIDIVFTITGLEKDPLLKPETWKAPAYLDPKDVLTKQEEQRLHTFMYDLGQVVFKHRILIKPYFQDKDKTKCGKLSFPRFRAVLDVLKLPIPDGEYNLLCKRFGHEGKEFNYVEFCEVLKRYSEFD